MTVVCVFYIYIDVEINRCERRAYTIVVTPVLTLTYFDAFFVYIT